MRLDRHSNQTATKKCIAVLFFSIGITFPVMSQSLLDWITDPIGSAGAYAESYVESKVSETLTGIWEGLLDSNIQGSLDENATKIAEFNIDDTTYPARINSNHPQWANDGNPLSSIRTRLAAAPIDYLRYNYKGGRIRELGKGAVFSRLSLQADSLKNANRIRQLSEILNQAAMDSVKALSIDANGAYLETLLKYPSLAILFNSHPDLIRLNASWKGLPIANDAKLLKYWGIIANKEDEAISKKLRPYSRHELKFTTNMPGEVLISSSKGEHIGIVGRDYIVSPHKIDILNLHPMPKATYKVEQNTYTTDHLGRVTKVVQYSLAKEKSDLKKGKIRAKNVMQLQSAPEQSQPFYIVPLKQNGTESRLNIVPLVKSDYNKTQLKAFEKKVKEVGKNNLRTTVKYELFYPSDTDSQVPEYILINISDNKYLLSNLASAPNTEYVINSLEKRNK